MRGGRAVYSRAMTVSSLDWAIVAVSIVASFIPALLMARLLTGMTPLLVTARS